MRRAVGWALLVLSAVASLQAPSAASAQPEPPSGWGVAQATVSIEPGDWAVWLGHARRVDGAPPICAPPGPCSTLLAAGEIEVAVGEASRAEPDATMRFTLRGDEHRLTLSTEARNEGRIAGGVVMGAGLGLGVIAGTTISFTGNCGPPSGGFCGWDALAIGSGLALTAIGVILGAVLIDQNDAPRLELEGSGGRRRVVRPFARTMRVGLGIGLSLLGAGAIAAIGMPAGMEATGDRDAVRVFSVAVAAASLAAPFLVTLAGHLTGGRGDVLGALLGALVGTGIGGLVIGIASAAGTTFEVAAAYGYPIGFAASVAGSVIGYEILHGEASGRSESGDDAPGAIAIAPSLAPVAGGATVGVLGSF